MMSAAECQAKADAALAAAAAVTNTLMRLHYETLAREWASLATMAGVQEALEAGLSERDPD